MTDEFAEEIEPTNKKIKVDPNLKKCSVPFCSTRALSGFSRIPTNEAKKQEWLKILEIPNILKPNSRICHRHFHESDFINSENRKRLKTNAIPLFGRTNDSVKIKEEESLESVLIEPDSVIIRQESSEQTNFQDADSKFERDPLLSDEKSSIDTKVGWNRFQSTFIDADSITIKEEDLEARPEMIESPSILRDNPLFETDVITVKKDPLDTNVAAIEQKNNEKIDHKKQKISWEDKVSNVSWVRKYECGHCEKYFDLLTALKRHIILEHQIEKVYDCEICCAIFTNGEALRDHIMSVHEEKKLFPCNFCVFKAAKYIDWKAHLLLAHEKTVLKCDICCIRFAQEYDLISHMKKTHDEALKSQKSSIPSTSKVKIKSHEVKKPEEFYACNHCFVCFKDKDKLAKHDKVCKDKKFQCTLCSGSYQKECHLERHISIKHPNSLETSPIRIENEVIGTTSESIRNKCLSCDAQFSTKTALENHVSTYHKNQVPKECPFCNAYFSSQMNKVTINRHINECIKECRVAKDKELPEEFENSQKSSNPDILHKCHECSAEFYTKTLLDSHILKHYIKCEICYLTFISKALLWKHMDKEHKVHEVKKPQESYTCHHCFVCFKDRDKLAKHDKVCKDKK